MEGGFQRTPEKRCLMPLAQFCELTPDRDPLPVRRRGSGVAIAAQKLLVGEPPEGGLSRDIPIECRGPLLVGALIDC
ncbi:MAG: hypothetical protein JWM75_2765 [Sphingomonas bacterium]|nr:hypothetical protein [Sphingomonas bacterium]